MTKIDKRAARKAYDKGPPVRIIPYLANPYHDMWNCRFEKEELDNMDFDKLCDNILYYHWDDGCGHRLAYYLL